MEEELQNVLYSPTWAVAAVCAVFIISCLIVERSIYFVGHVFRKHRQVALLEALEKIKEELMLVGFISLALTVGQRAVAQVCVPEKWTDVMLQCRKHSEEEVTEHFQRVTAEASDVLEATCPKGKSPVIHLEGIHQLHILLFVLAVVHIVYSVLIMALGMWKVSQWKVWEERSNLAETISAHGPIRFAKDVTFIRRHATSPWSQNCFLGYLAAFFQQFFKSVSETDYLTLRHGFIQKHNLENFNFHKYIVRSLEEDFKRVVGISPSLWAYAILLTLFNVEGWWVNFIASMLPLLMVLIVGAKLRYIITHMAVKCFEKHAVVEGMPSVKPTDEHFWFNRPHLILYCIHFVLFQDAFQVSLHLWVTFTFPEHNCFSQHPYILLGRLILGVIAQVICGYVMLPIYAIVSQMGSEMKHKDGVVDDSVELAGLSPKKDANGDSWQISSMAVDSKFSIDNDHQSPDRSDLENPDSGESTFPESSKQDSSHLKKPGSILQRMTSGIQGPSYQSLSPSKTRTSSL